MVEIIKGLQKYVQSYTFKNERLMKSKKQQDGFNIALMQSLDTIEKEMDKETESSKSRSSRFHDDRRKTRSVDRNHHHSQKNSFRKVRSSSSSSLFRKHKGRTRVDDL
jgi:hypothetical protein